MNKIWKKWGDDTSEIKLQTTKTFTLLTSLSSSCYIIPWWRRSFGKWLRVTSRKPDSEEQRPSVQSPCIKWILPLTAWANLKAYPSPAETSDENTDSRSTLDCSLLRDYDAETQINQNWIQDPQKWWNSKCYFKTIKKTKITDPGQREKKSQHLEKGQGHGHGRGWNRGMRKPGTGMRIQDPGGSAGA